MACGSSTDRVPPFRPFDLLSAPNQQLVLLENADHRIGVESVCGAQASFRRHVDFDTLYFQFAGSTMVETEYGAYDITPGQVLFIPEGISHRSSGTADSLRWFLFANEPFTEFMSESEYTGESEFRVIRHGGPSWKIAAGSEKAPRSGIVHEHMICWDHRAEDVTVIRRDYEDVVSASSTHISEKHSGIKKLRVFDIFKSIAGQKNGIPPIFRSPHLECKTYNITGEQFAFHRALRSEEVRIQFRGDAQDMSEIENTLVHPGEVTVIPRGIAHSVVTEPANSPLFLRLNFYSNLRWQYPVDLSQHAYNSTFETQTTVHHEASWRIESGLVVPQPATK
jgi:mannose-6-phosphate isomerase-like protein (cupin superfamily)